jgi:hypothetical protein
MGAGPMGGVSKPDVRKWKREGEERRKKMYNGSRTGTDETGRSAVQAGERKVEEGVRMTTRRERSGTGRRRHDRRGEGEKKRRRRGWKIDAEGEMVRKGRWHKDSSRIERERTVKYE